MRIDLHTHSNVSDGTDTPAELMEKAKAAGLDVVGLTDHDTFAGWEEAGEKAVEIGITLVRGTEISCSHNGVSMHLLALLPRADHSELAEILERSRGSRVVRIREMVTLLSRDFPISWEDIHAPEGSPVGRPHIADALVKAGVFPDRAACFAQVLHPSSPYYVRHWAPDPITAVALVRSAGGVPIAAHPRAWGRQRRHISRQTIGDMVDAGLFALEAHHRDHNREAVAEVEEMAKYFGIEVTGSSDYHGTGKPNRLGENLTTPEVFEKLTQAGETALIGPKFS